MQNIDLICVGKLNAPYFAAGVAEYQKRLGAFCNFRIIELPEAAIADKNASDAQISKALDKEATAILSSLRKGEYLAALCVEGKQFSSEELAKLIADRANSGAGDIASFYNNEATLSVSAIDSVILNTHRFYNCGVKCF